MITRYRLFAVVFLFLTAACMNAGDDGILVSTKTFDFNDGDQGWEHGFSDYPAGKDSAAFEFRYEYTSLPSYLSSNNSILLSGNNLNGDLFMFLKKKLTGLQPDAAYTLSFNVEFASSAMSGSLGTAGSPGEGVFLKVGGTAFEPKATLSGGKYEINIDKGNQGSGGADMVTIGNIVVSNGSGNYAMATRASSTTNMPLMVQSNGDGELWLIVGTDSAFRGITTLYYTKVIVVLSSRN